MVSADEAIQVAWRVARDHRLPTEEMEAKVYGQAGDTFDVSIYRPGYRGGAITVFIDKETGNIVRTQFER
ncbi:hypothetical protein KRM28CT15_20220 [Krasilnikovia sp. M28-CT-15]